MFNMSDDHVFIGLLTVQKGLALHLAEIDLSNRPLKWHLQNIVIFCRIHFLRGISETLKTDDNERPGVAERMASLVHCESQEEYFQLCELLMRKCFFFRIYARVLEADFF